MLRFCVLFSVLLLLASCATPPVAPVTPIATVTVSAAVPPAPTQPPFPPAATDILPTSSPSPTHISPAATASATATRVPPTRTRIPPTTSPTRTPLPPTPTATRTRTTANLLKDGSLRLPDLAMLEPDHLVLEDTPEGRRLLRLTNYIVNWGPGTLQVLGNSDRVSERTVVMQHLFRADGSFAEHPAGIFFFHLAHNHWHFENFAIYQLWSLTTEGRRDEVVAKLDKVSYCLRDTGRTTMASAALTQTYTECEAALQGISAGWVDSYEYDLPGQDIDITGLRDGIYALECIVDPGNRLLETDDTNNSTTIYLLLQENTVKVITREAMLSSLGD